MPERVIRLAAASPVPTVLEVAIAPQVRPSRWRRVVAVALLRLAGRLLRLRVRIVAAGE